MKEFFAKLFNLVPDDVEYETLKYKASQYDQLCKQKKEKILENIRVGSRVKIKHTSGFSRGSQGFVKYIEPNHQRVWVLRDGPSSDAYFYPGELELLE